jgi:hypothetical protein
VDMVEKLVIETFGVKDYERFYSERGRHFPRFISDKLVKQADEALLQPVS